jgi:hypothetical protein
MVCVARSCPSPRMSHRRRPQRVPRLMRLSFRVGETVVFGGCDSATTTRMRGDMTGGLCGT